MSELNFTSEYFSTLLDLVKKGERKFPQALIFEGSDTIGQYLFTLELARKLNCQNNGDIDCGCINCKWIHSHTHPAIQNVSQIHFKGEGDETKTVISARQAREIENALTLSSDYHRFFIFFSSKEKIYADGELLPFEKFNYDSSIDYEIAPLTYSTFHTATPNALLKSIEEPPLKTTFVFLTKSKEDILPTIVSRCLTFKFSGQRSMSDNTLSINLFKNYPNYTYETALNTADSVLDTVKNNDVSLTQLLDGFMEYLLLLMKQNLDNAEFVNKINHDMDIINHALKQIKANMQDKIVIETLMLKLV